MKNLTEFRESMVKIEFIEQSGCFGHYPFQLFAEKSDGTNQIEALFLGGNVKECYQLFAIHVNKGAKRVYMSLDYPASGDISKDFVVLFQYEQGNLNLTAIPYSEFNGECFNLLTQRDILSTIKKELEFYLK